MADANKVIRKKLTFKGDSKKNVAKFVLEFLGIVLNIFIIF